MLIILLIVYYSPSLSADIVKQALPK